jgi:hypothetical protein
MSDIQTMNSEMLDILKNYIEIFSFFNEKLEEIKADEILNINLELLKASITDLNINIANFKSDLQYNYDKANLEINDKQESNQEINQESNLESENKLANQSIDNYTELDRKNLLALFFMYLMQIDNESILNNPASGTHSINKSINTSEFRSPASTTHKKTYDDSDPDLD